MRCLVLGGGGFIGVNLCHALSAEGMDLRVFGHPPRVGQLPRGAELVEADFDDVAKLHDALTGCDVAFHLISATTPASANADMLNDLQQNVANTLHLLELARTTGLGKIVFLSSGGTVYGVPGQVPTPEEAPTWPITAYGISKLAIERYLALHHHLHGLDYCILRVGNPFGEFQVARKHQGAVAAFLTNVIQGKPIEIWGDGQVRRDYVYVGDVVDALLKAMRSDAAEKLFNVASGIGRSLTEIVADIERLVGHPVRVDHRPARPVDVPVSVLDVARAGRVLQWQPVTSWEDGLARSHRWLQQHLAG
jgi:UDP-glucose 4-epimerase